MPKLTEEEFLNTIQLSMQGNSFALSNEASIEFSHTMNLQVESSYSPTSSVMSYQKPQYYQDKGFLLEQLKAMQKQEKDCYRCKDYLKFPSSAYPVEKIFEFPSSAYPVEKIFDSIQGTKGKKIVDEQCREKIVDWMYKVVDYFNINRQVCFYALNYLDRFMAMVTVDRFTYKLAAMTALIMALKIHGSHNISLKDIVAELSRGQFNFDDVVQMEIVMLKTLSWRTHPPSTVEYIVKILELNSFTNKPIQEFDLMSVLNLAKYYVELSSFDYYFVTEHSSNIALASILNAMQTLGLFQNLQYGTIDTYSMSIAKFVNEILDAIGVDRDGVVIATCRDKLWEVYHRSQEYQRKRKLAMEQMDKSVKRRNIFASIKRTTSAPMKRRHLTGFTSSPNSIV
jgi:hypothetical protein